MITTINIVDHTTALAEVSLPHWAKRRLFEGVRPPVLIDLQNHLELILPIEMGLTGHQLIASHVSLYGSISHEVHIGSNDLIHRTLGLNEIYFFSTHWRDMPWLFRELSYGKSILALRDVVVDEDGAINIPYLSCAGIRPKIDWIFATNVFTPDFRIYRV